ncbi:MFS transporter [Steroidobacter agaridevorans]|uniref:MFS transporter n=1 Tax=Steroidobacter agaridevorans TaxID=2695856 RepID=A0A829Y8M1_9GAMM|nr:MFS transporter [Steroidobacter agaridevorans]GFE79659.1 MFS transporter [Steroidobacter agaridevorans]GFE90799.1 MFS transporter [Steroidobacter agaridevorans]
MQQSGYKNYLLTLLLLILAFNFMDRLVLGVVLQDIKVDLALNDTQLGFFTGIAFAIFYAVMGVPIARWADRGNRVTIISFTAALWSVAVAMCGAASSFIQLMLIRIGVAVGEAGCQPPALSLISDYFSRAERPRAISLYNLGWPVALVTGYFAGGWLNEWYGWRTTFVIVGLPGLALALLAVLTLREPRRDKLAAAAINPESRRSKNTQPSLREVFVTMRGNAAFRHVLLCLSLSHFFTYGIMQWQPAFFVRSHGLGTGELGTWLAIVYGGGGLLGTFLGGELAWRYAANNERLQMVAIALLYALFGVLTAVVYLSPDKYLAFAALGISAIGGAATNGPIFAATQTLMPPRMRAVSIAVVLFFCNLIGMGLGPLAAGALSDAFQPIFGADSLRYALVVFCPGYFWCAWHLWMASKTVADDVAAVQVEDVSHSAPAIDMPMSKGMRTVP